MWKYTSQCVNHVKTVLPPLLQNTTQCFAQQTRNTFVFRRKYKPPLLRKGEHFRRLGAKYFIYELIENKNVIKPKPIDIILLKDVNNFGEEGDRITVHPVIAYDKFLLPQLAVYASPENMKKYYIPKDQRKVVYSSPYVKETIDFLTTAHLAIEMSPRNPWTIEKWHIKLAFRKMKYMVPESAITLPQEPITGPKPDLEDKQFYVTVTINNTEQVKVRCTIKHWTNHVDYNHNFYSQRGTAVFPEDQVTLDEMPIMIWRKDNNAQ